MVQASKPITLGLNGQKHLELSQQDNIRALMFAWDEMKQYRSVLQWSWVSRGLVTKEEMAEMNPDCPPEEPDTSRRAFKELVPEIPLLVPILGPNVRQNMILYKRFEDFFLVIV